MYAFALQPFAFDFFCFGNDFFFPVVILGIELISVESELSSVGTDDCLIVYMELDLIVVRNLLRQDL